MKVFHQHGHNFVWNLDSLTKDESGAGHIISPVNIPSDQISKRISKGDRKKSFFDPQFYLPNDAAKKLKTYSFFPDNFLAKFSTRDFIDRAHEIAKICLEFQHNLGFLYATIPTRFFPELPDNYLNQLQHLFLEPFLSEYSHISNAAPLLLTVIVKPIQLEDGILRDELITWITNFSQLKGVYLIFDNNFHSKQIKDPEYLSNQLLFIHYLRLNGLEVHVGYTNTEAFLLSVADPTSVSMGAYENLRSFGTLRLETRDQSSRRSPSPRIYSGKLIQWMDYNSLPALRNLFPNWHNLFDASPYKAYLLSPTSNLNFQKKEIYKHHFYVFSRLIKNIPENISDRLEYLRTKTSEAISLFEEIRGKGIVLDSDSDGSHLISWMNALAIYQTKI